LASPSIWGRLHLFSSLDLNRAGSSRVIKPAVGMPILRNHQRAEMGRGASPVAKLTQPLLAAVKHKPEVLPRPIMPLPAPFEAAGGAIQMMTFGLR
jgi:hypothetical protein